MKTEGQNWKVRDRKEQKPWNISYYAFLTQKYYDRKLTLTDIEISFLHKRKVIREFMKPKADKHILVIQCICNLETVSLFSLVIA